MPDFTGERVIPGEVDVDLLNEHMARCAFAVRLARGDYGYPHLPRRVEVNARLGASELESHRA